MKFLFTLFLLLLFFLSGCDTNPSQVIYPDDDARKTIIIEEVPPDDIRVTDEEKDEDIIYDDYTKQYQSTLGFFRRYTESITDARTFPIIFSCFINVVSRKEFEGDTLTAIDLGTVKLGDFLFAKDEESGFLRSDYYKNQGIAYKTGWEFFFNYVKIPDIQENFNPHDNCELDFSLLFNRFTLPLTITDSYILMEVNFNLTIQGLNRVTNLFAGQELNPEDDLKIKTKYDIYGFWQDEEWVGTDLRITPQETTNSEDSTSGSAIRIIPKLPTNEIIIPGREISELVRRFPESNNFYIRIRSEYSLPDLHLSDHEGVPYQNVRIDVVDDYLLEIVFKK